MSTKATSLLPLQPRIPFMSRLLRPLVLTTILFSAVMGWAGESSPARPSMPEYPFERADAVTIGSYLKSPAPNR